MIDTRNKMTICLKLLAAIIAMLTVIAVSSLEGASAASHSQKYWMKKTLKAYKAGKYEAAKKYNKKMRKTAKEKCVKKMSKKMKRKYKAVINKWPTEQTSFSEEYLQDYYYTDYNNDGKADLIIRTGTCYADAVCRVYTYKKGKVKSLGKLPGGFASISAYPGGKGVVLEFTHTGNEQIWRVYRKKGKTVKKRINSRDADESDMILLRNALKRYEP